MKKLLSILTAFSLTATVIPTTFGYSKNESILKTDLKESLTKLTVNGNETNTPLDVLMKIIEVNVGSGVTWQDVLIKEFHPASAETDGSAIIYALPESQFTGEVVINIIQLGQRDLKDLLKDWIDLGFVFNETVAQRKAEEILDFLDLKDKVILGQPNNGQIHVVANDPNLIGETDFTYQIQKDLSQIITRKVVDGDEANTPETVLAKIIELNPETGINFENVKLSSFIPASLTNNGSAILEPISNEFTGTANIIITKLNENDDEKEVVDRLNNLESILRGPKGITLEELTDYYNSFEFLNHLEFFIPKFKKELYQATILYLKLPDGSERPLTQNDLDQFLPFNYFIYYNYGKFENQKMTAEFRFIDWK